MGCGLGNFFFFFNVQKRQGCLSTFFDPLPHQQLYRANSQSSRASRARKKLSVLLRLVSSAKEARPRIPALLALSLQKTLGAKAAFVRQPLRP